MPIYVGVDTGWYEAQQRAKDNAWRNLISAIASSQERKKEEGRSMIASMAATTGGFDSPTAAQFAKEYANDPEMLAMFNAAKSGKQAETDFYTRQQQASADYSNIWQDMGNARTVAQNIPDYGMLGGFGRAAQEQMRTDAVPLLTQDPTGYQTAWDQTPANQRAAVLAALQHSNFPTSRLVDKTPGYDMAGLYERGIVSPEQLGQAALIDAHLMEDPQKIAAIQAQAAAKEAEREAGIRTKVEEQKALLPGEVEKARQIAQAQGRVDAQGHPIARPSAGGGRTPTLAQIAKDKAAEVRQYIPDVTPAPQNPNSFADGARFASESKAAAAANKEADKFSKVVGTKLAQLESKGTQIPLDKLRQAIETGRRKKMADSDIYRSILADLDKMIGGTSGTP